MVTIVCGDNTQEARSRFLSIKDDYIAKQYETNYISSSQLNSLSEQLSYSSLFSVKTVYICENILSKKQNRELLLKAISSSDPEILIYEDAMDSRSIKRYFPKSKIIVCALPSSIWKFIDGLYSGNLKQSMSMFNDISRNVAVAVPLIHYMMLRRVKELILVKHDQRPSKLASWQVGKLSAQAKKWDTDRLSSFYKKLIEIEMQFKNGTMIYDLEKALQITLCFYL